MEYREYPPPASLARQVECVWVLRDPAAAQAPRNVFPDGRCELIVHLGAPPRCWDAVDGWHAQAHTLFAAQRLAPVRLAATGALECVGVRLVPALSNLVLRGAGRDLRDRIIDLHTLDASFAASFVAAARSFVAGEASILWRLLEERLGDLEVDERVCAAVATIEAHAGRVRIDALARAASLSLRGFQHRFSAVVGLAPKEFARLMRLRATLRALEESDERLSELAAAGGFADQAHATRELRRATGLTPARLRAELRRGRDGDAALRLAAAFVRGRALT